MPVMYIYQASEKIAAKKFENFFYIVKEIGRDKLFWKVDHEPSLPKRGGETQIWIMGASAGAQIAYILPSWQLIIDGTVLERGFYHYHIYVERREVELQYQDYRFICSFPSSQSHPTSKLTELHPAQVKNDR